MIILLSTLFIIIYIIIILWFSDSINKYSLSKKKFKEYKLPFVSIIISAHNEENNINNLLESLSAQTYNKKL